MTQTEYLRTLGLIGSGVDERVVFLMSTAQVTVTAFGPDTAGNLLALRHTFARQLRSEAETGMYFVAVYRTMDRDERPGRYIVEADDQAQAIQAALKLEEAKGYNVFMRAIATRLDDPTQVDHGRHDGGTRGN